jgi:hypothetical protein
MNLKRYEKKIFSQHGEDGVINHLCPEMEGRFCEFGIGRNINCNTMALLAFQNWTGVMIDDKRKNCTMMRNLVKDMPRHISGTDGADQRLKVIHKYLNPMNINEYVNEDYDLLSIDVDGKDIHLWRALRCKPRFVVIEVDTEQSFGGATLADLRAVGKKKGYSLVYVESSKTNAFFRRKK